MYFSGLIVNRMKVYSPYIRLLADDSSYLMNVVVKGASNFVHQSTTQQAGTLNGVACWEIIIDFKVPSGNPSTQLNLFDNDDIELTDPFTSNGRIVVVKTLFYASNNALLFENNSKIRYNEAEPIK